jgi:EmrB/QacA subfamily drug resistance transporter
MQITEQAHADRSAQTKGTSRHTTLAVVCIAQFLTVLDFQSITVALPALQAALHIPQATLHWIVSAHALAFGGLLLLTGRTTSLVGRRRSFMIGLALSGIGTLVCGLAQGALGLIAGRVIQGVAAAIITPAALSLLSATFAAGPERTRALGIWGAVAPIGGSVGIVVGGWLISQFGWPWVFWIALPIVAVALVLSRLLVDDDRAPMKQLDVVGAVAGTLAVTLLVYGLSEMQRAGVTASTTLGSLVLAGALLIGFLLIERRVHDPLVPLRIFRQRILVGANLLTIIHAATTNTPLFFLTLYLQQIKGYSPLMTGLAFLPANLTIIVGSSLGSALTTRLGLRRALLIGMSIIGAALLLLAQIAVGSHFVPDLLPGLLLLGLGLGAVGVAVNVAGIDHIDQAEHGLAWGLVNTSARLGTALGLALLVTLATARTSMLSENGQPTDAATIAGFQAAFGTAALIAAIGGLAAFVLFRQPAPISA